MTKLLNRLAWFISLLFWFFITFSLTAFLWELRYIWDEEIIIFLLICLFFWTIFKKIFLSKGFIKTRLEFFANSIWDNFINKSPAIRANPVKETKKEKLNLEEEISLENNKQKVETNDYKAYQVPRVKKAIKQEPSKLSLAIKKFFSENLLAKLGWILVFLWVLFLLGLVISAIWPVGRLIIWFAIWFVVFFAWVWLDKKDLENEWRILLWIWILINYLVILSWRYLLWDDVNNILTVWTTFLFLIFNTLFAVVTSLVYKSRNLLLFSFIFAFINPLLVWGSSDNSYTLVWYSLIVAFGWLFLSLKQKDILLAIWVFILSNILFLIAPFSSDIHWILKLVWSAIISIATISTVYKLDIKKLSLIFIWSYIFLVLLLWSWDLYIRETTSFISYMITILLYFGIGIYYFLKTSFNSLVYILLAPIMIILWLSFSWWLISIVLAMAVIVLIYLLWFNLIKNKLPDSLKYVFFAILWIYIFLTNSYLSIDTVNLDLASFVTVLIVSFVFIFTSYYLSTKKNLEFLYSIWTIWWILTLAPIIVNKVSSIQIQTDVMIVTNSANFYLSIAALIIFAISNWALPFINQNLIEKRENLKNVIIWSIAWLLFLGFELFSYWNIYFEWISLGFAFAWLAIVYFIMAFMMMNKWWIKTVKEQSNSKNIVLSYLWISISVFSLAIALIFSSYDAIVSSVWLFEATIMFYFFNKTKDSKIFVAWIILFMVWIFKLFNLIDLVSTRDFIFLIPFSIVFISLILNLKFLDFDQNSGKRIPHDILHILWIWTLAILLLEIIPSTWYGWSILWITIFISISSIIYAYFNSKILKIFFIIWLAWFLSLHVWESESIFRKIDRNDLEYLRILQYISTALLWWAVLFWNKINKLSYLNTFVNLIFAFYLLVITSIYVYDIFNTTFAVTIYWWVSASIMLFYGLAKDIIKLRTIWLYLVSLTALKIFLYDIWYGIDDAVSRVVALIVIWVLFITISTRYTKKYWNNITKEFSPSNLINKKETNPTTPHPWIPSPSKEKEATKNWVINEKIEDIDVWNISSVQFKFKSESISIRAVNLVKITKLLITKLNWKTVFKKNELKSIYTYVKSNYKSDLSKANYDKIISILERFVKEWWEVKLVEK